MSRHAGTCEDVDDTPSTPTEIQVDSLIIQRESDLVTIKPTSGEDVTLDLGKIKSILGAANESVDGKQREEYDRKVRRVKRRFRHILEVITAFLCYPF